jgi:LDH2 family malate/lactate/ureidoglycolate dehydrogenase
LEILQRKQQDTPTGWVQDKEGNPTHDPNILKQGGALLPLGGDREHGSHKGYALGAIVDLFSALLSGANYAPWVPPFPAYVPMPAQQPGKGIGHFLGAMRVDAFRPVDEYKSHMDHWIRGFRSATPIDEAQPVLVPGDPEREAEADRMATGIPLMNSVVDDLNALSQRLGVPSLG